MPEDPLELKERLSALIAYYLARCHVVSPSK